MRLGGYILLELVVGSLLAAGGTAATWVAARELLSSSTAQAYATQLRDSLAEDPPRDGMTLSTAGMLPLEEPGTVAALPAKYGYFLGIHDDVLLTPLELGHVKRAKFNRGGSSVSLRLDFIGGGRASFKPDQTNLQSVPRKEVAAYRLNRLLGLASVAPAIARAIPKSEIIATMDPDARSLLPRFNAEVLSVNDGDTVSGSLAWWIPEIVDARIDGFKVDSLDGIVTWKRYLTVGEPVPYSERLLLPQMSNLLVFDFLINNVDRWSGSNVKASPDGRWLYFMDNALSFSPSEAAREHTRVYLERSQKFSRALYTALVQLDIAHLRGTMTVDTGPYVQLLTEKEMAAVLERRDYIVKYIDDLISAHGQEAVLVFP